MGAASHLWRVGDVIADQYEVAQIHSDGGMGLVYRVRHLQWDTDLAVKSPRPELFGTPRGRELFIAEAETWVSLGLHPNVCSCHYVRTLDGIPRVFAEYVPGGSLRDRIEDRSLYTGDDRRIRLRLLDLAIQTAWGLQHAHDRGVVHQDVKPANVLLDGEGTAKVTDFGLARGRSAAADAGGSAAAGAGAGAHAAADASEAVARGPATMLVPTGGLTRAYASPEQAEGLALTRRTDVYSFAVSLLEMFTGEVTWMLGSVAGEALAELRAGGGLGVAGVPAMPEDVADLLEHCLAHRPEDRPRSMAEVAAALRASYRRIAGHEHQRPEPYPADLRAGELNNRALSLLDLGRSDEAEESFAAALAADPRHPEAVYNRGLLQWRRGAVTDEDLVAELEAVHADAGRSRRVGELLAEVGRERGETLGDQGSEVRRVDWYIYEPWGEAWRGERMRRNPPGMGIRLTPDARLALTECDNAVRLWDVATGRRLLELADATHAVDISSDGRYAAAAGSDELVRLWDLSDLSDLSAGRVLRTFTPYYRSGSTAVKTLRLSVEAGIVAAGTSDNTVVVWDLGTGESRLIVEGYHNGPIELSSRGLILFRSKAGIECVSAARDAQDDRRVVLPAEGQLDIRVHLVADESTAATVHSGKVRVWDLQAGRLLHTIDCRAGRAALSDDSRLLLTGSHDGAVRLWEVATGRCLRTYRGHSDEVDVVALPPGGGALSASRDGTVRRWPLPGGYSAPPRLSRPRGHAELVDDERRVAAMVAEADAVRRAGRLNESLDILTRARATPGHQRTPEALKVWRALGSERGVVRTGLRAGWSSRVVASYGSGVSGLACSADGKTLAVRLRDSTSHVLDAATGESRLIIGDLPNTWGRVELSPDGRRLMLANPDGSLDVWSTTTGDRLASLRLTLGAGAASFSTDGRRALVRGGDNEVRLWDVESGRCLRRLDAVHYVTTAVWLSPDGRLAASSGMDEAIRVWDLDDGRCLRTLRGHSAVHAIEVSPFAFPGPGFSSGFGSGSGFDRRILVSAGWYDDRTIRVWDFGTGECVRVLKLDGGNARVARPTGDGRFVLSCGEDSAVGVWDVAAGRCLRALTGHDGPVEDIVFGPDENTAFSAGTDGTVRAWELDWDLAVRGSAGAGRYFDSDGRGGGHAVVP